MKGIVARFRHGPKTAERGDLRLGISAKGRIVLKKQGEALAKWMLRQKGDKAILINSGVKLELSFSGVRRTLTSTACFADGFKAAMSRQGVNVHLTQPVKQHALRVTDNWDFEAMARLKKLAGGEMRALAIYHKNPSIVSGESPESQASRIEKWASRQTKRVQKAAKGPVAVVIGFSHEPGIGSARGKIHGKRKGERYLVAAGPKPITTPGGLITHVANSGVATLHEMRFTKGRHAINYVGHLN